MFSNRIAKFHKIPYEQWCIDSGKSCDEWGLSEVRECYQNIVLPTRATAGSAGYDFHAPCDVELMPGDSAVIHTGVCAEIAQDWVLLCFPRSSLGFNYFIQLANTTGVIDSDYYRADNHGHIAIKLRNTGNETLSIKQGDRIAQGVFVPYGITTDDETTEVRTGGFGSTGA